MFFNGYPLILKASAAQIRVGSTLTVTAGYEAKHGFEPAAGIKLSGGGVTHTTDKDGKAIFQITRSGTLVLRASGKGYIRAAPVEVTELP